ncbi:hypothetical protein [Thiohalocapsa sp. ML1]|uniref:hypothetical protein n=1 Tax=Thiohalocapsa sp. ML1 TaxID=1431688 RepID=UPI0007321D46|nr:hypothetical protein [Thiohalocapsa sp. ML1]
MTTASDATTLRTDAALAEPLRRVAFEAGMLLGLEATRDEQAYHRRRVTRAQYWLHGAGTVAGLRVSIDPVSSATPNANQLVRLLVAPGVGLDGLGRELLLHETHCLDLGEWLRAQDPDWLRGGFDAAAERLHLGVFARYQDCPVGLQPVLARKLNLGTDPVQPSRIADAVLLELDLLDPTVSLDRLGPWPLHGPVQGAAAGPLPDLSVEEQQALADLPADADAERARLTLRLRLLHLFDAPWSAPALTADLLALARLPLARLTLATTDPATDLVVNPARIRIDNLSRPFVPTAAQLDQALAQALAAP